MEIGAQQLLFPKSDGSVYAAQWLPHVPYPLLRGGFGSGTQIRHDWRFSFMGHFCFQGEVEERAACMQAQVESTDQ